MPISSSLADSLVMSLDMTAEDFNTEVTHIEHDLAERGEDFDRYGFRIQVDTPWAMGFVDRQGVSLV